MRVISFVSSAPNPEQTALANTLAAHAGSLERGSVTFVNYGGGTERSATDTNQGAAGETLIPSTEQRLTDDLKDIAHKGAQFAVIDTPFDPIHEFESRIRAADLVVLPIRPVESSFRNLASVVGSIEQLGKPFVFVIYGADPDATSTSATAIALAQFGTVCPVILGATGQVAPDSSDEETRNVFKEFSELWCYLKSRVGRPSAERATQNVDPAERRRYPRWGFAADASLLWDGREIGCRVSDISAGGIGVLGDQLPEQGSNVSLVIPNLGTVAAVVAHKRSNRVGLKFSMEPSAQLDLVNKISGLIKAPQIEDDKASKKSAANLDMPSKKLALKRAPG